MIGKIISIEDNISISLSISIYNTKSIINNHIIMESDNEKYVGEILSINNNIMNVMLIGEIVNNTFIYGNLKKPPFNSSCYLITNEELNIIFNDEKNKIIIGKSFIYDYYDVGLSINDFFSNHFAILGNTGSGKSYATAKIIQSIFYQSTNIPYKANFFIFDAYGEYRNVFNKINEKFNHINYKVYTTNLKDKATPLINIPFYLLSIDDIALLLEADTMKQLSVIKDAIKLTKIFQKDYEIVLEQKNDIIARTMLDIIYSGINVQIRTKIISFLSKFNTNDINLGVTLNDGGWSKVLRQCLYIDKDGKIPDIELVCRYLEKFIKITNEDIKDEKVTYSIDDFYEGLEYACLKEGILTDDNVYEYTNILKVRLSSLIKSEYYHYFTNPNYLSKLEYIKLLLTTSDNNKAQVVNFNINYVDDRMGKILTKIFSKWLFDFSTVLPVRASLPIHIILEEAHRYVQNDNDVKVLGYNIFDRIAKEGRKYGILLGLISQRPAELSKTTISQCSNFLAFKMFYPEDLDFIKQVLPNINNYTVDKLKTLYPGTCVAFGNSFKMPILINIDKPNPAPDSSNTDIEKNWYIKNN